MNKPRYWHALANKAMQVMDIEMAIRVYRQIGDAGMVMGLEKLKFLEDKVRSDEERRTEGWSEATVAYLTPL